MLKFKTTELLFRCCEVDTMRIIKEDPCRGNNARGNVVDGNARGQETEYGNVNLGIRTTSTDKMLLMNAQENGAVLDKE
ncbi:hypothetical protein Tco_0607006 [Tanacetum coccineum]